MMSSRKLYIDSIKGYGILLVMATHAALNYSFMPYLILTYMSLFFICTGYTNKGVDLRKVAKRLLIPYFFYGICILIIETVSPLTLKEGNGLEWLGLIYSRRFLYLHSATGNIPLMTPFIGPLWFLSCLMSAYFLLFIYDKLHRTIYKVGYVVMGLLMTVLYNQWGGYLLPWCIDVAFISFMLILLGRYLNKYSTLFLCKKISYLLLLTYCLLVYYLGDADFYISEFGNLGLFSIPLFIIASVLYFVIVSHFFYSVEHSRFSFIASIFSFIGKMSLRLLCIHCLVIIEGYNLLYKYFSISWDFKSFVIVMILNLFISYYLGLLFERLSRTVPFFKYL